MSFQSKALINRQLQDESEKYYKNKKYERNTLKIGLSCILLLILITAGFDVYPKIFPPKYTECPRILNMNGHEWGLVPVPEDTSYSSTLGKYKEILDFYNLDGYTDSKSRLIFYRQGSPRIKSILWHEIFHAISYEKTGTPGSTYWDEPVLRAVGKGHNVVYNIGEFMDNFERANPEFMEWKDE